MRHINWVVLAPQVCQLAKAAGNAVLSIYQNDVQETSAVSYKSDNSPLTLADITAHHIIVDGLVKLTPDIPIVSEEDSDSLVHRQSGGLFWLIDPLDGTKEFLARNGEFTVNIALISDGQPIWGVVYAPALGELFWGGNAFGAFSELAGLAVPISISPKGALRKPMRVVASKSHQNLDTDLFIKKLGVTEIILAGSSLKFCRIAQGQADVYPRLGPTCEWDTAAAQAILEGAGGYVYDVSGMRLLYGKTSIINPSFIAATVSLDRLMLSQD